jgi:hypothetical protein
MAWVRQHCEGGRVVVVVRVGADGGQFAVRLQEPRPPEPSNPKSRDGLNQYSYRSREFAFEAADALVRHRHDGHTCSRSCSAWTEDADVG